MATANENFIKLRTAAGCTLLILLYPIVIIAAIITKIVKFVLNNKTRKSVANEIAVVTGSGHGLGQAIALELAKNGCAVAVVDLNEQGAENTAQLIRDMYKVPAKAYKTDVSDYKQVVALNEHVCNDLGVPTILVNNAGLLIHKNPLNPSAEDVQKMINVNLTAHFFTNQVFLPKMKELNKGHIVAVASAAAQFPLLYNAVYSSTKVGVRNLMRLLRMELKIAQLNIRTTIACPVFLNTNETIKSVLDASTYAELQPVIDGGEAAKRIVDGMLSNEQEILMPSYLQVLYRLIETLPNAWIDAYTILSMRSFLQDGKIMELK